MLYNLEPGDDLTGGPWYTEDKVLDVAFVTALTDVVYRIVDKKSFPSNKKANSDSGNDRVQRFYAPGYQGYATAEDVYEFIINSKVIHDEEKTFGVSHVHKLLEVLCYNSQIEKRADGVTYRSILNDEDLLGPDEQDQYYNNAEFNPDEADALLEHKGYTEAPCGRCPVFNICGNPGSEVSAATCVYWDEWIKQVRPSELF
jgi:DNA-directed RNA polymerase III subunit RPC6